MALSLSQTSMLAAVMSPGKRVASYGYPDVIAPLEMIEDILGDKYRSLKYRTDNYAICKRHGIEPRNIPDAHSFVELLGGTLDVYDIVKERGCETYCNLNEPQNTANFYDVVLDVGTAEHCFNIAQAVMNMANQLREGGVIIHENPANWVNHGFYSLSPTLFADFYAANGFALLDCRLVTRDGRSFCITPHRRIVMAEEVNVFAVARRIKCQGLVYPTQGKYAGNSAPAAEVRALTEKVAA